MSPARQLIAIAASVGWVGLLVKQLRREHPNDCRDWLHGCPPWRSSARPDYEVPDFTEDRRAMIEVVKSLTGAQQSVFISRLADGGMSRLMKGGVR